MVSRGQRDESPTVVNFGFLDRKQLSIRVIISKLLLNWNRQESLISQGRRRNVSYISSRKYSASQKLHDEQKNIISVMFSMKFFFLCLLRFNLFPLIKCMALFLIYISDIIRSRKPKLTTVGDSLRWPRGTLHPLKLALTSPTSSSRSVGIVRACGLKPRSLFLFRTSIKFPRRRFLLHWDRDRDFYWRERKYTCILFLFSFPIIEDFIWRHVIPVRKLEQNNCENYIKVVLKERVPK
jgi:hypothetical protein